MKKYQNLLYLGVAPKQRGDVRGAVSTQYMDPEHVVYMDLTVPGSMEQVQFIGDQEGTIREPVVRYDNPQRVYLSTSYLKKILDNVTSDSILMTVEDDAPITLEWGADNDHWRVMIAPRIRSENQPEDDDI